jgi:hypothetical protein
MSTLHVRRASARQQTATAAPQAPVVNVPAPIVQVRAPVVNVQPPHVSLAAPVVNVPAPVVKVAAPAVNIPAPVVHVHVAAPTKPAPQNAHPLAGWVMLGLVMLFGVPFGIAFVSMFVATSQVLWTHHPVFTGLLR